MSERFLRNELYFGKDNLEKMKNVKVVLRKILK